MANSKQIESFHPLVSHSLAYTPFTLALLIRSETGFAPMRAFTLQHLIRITDLIRIKPNHLKEVVLHRFSLLRVLIASVDATRTRTKAEQIRPNQCQMLHSYIYGVGCQKYPLTSYRLGFYCSCMSSVNLNIAIYNIIAM